MSSVSNYKEAHRRDELEFILLAVDAFHECVRPPAASGERGRAFLQSNLGNSSRVLAIGDDDLTLGKCSRPYLVATYELPVMPFVEDEDVDALG